jgi:hypothetical protein
MGKLVYIIGGIVLIVIIALFFLFGSKNDSSLVDLNSNNSNVSNNAVSISQGDCGSVPESYLNSVNTNSNPARNEAVACMSDNMNNCRIGQVKFACTTSSCVEGDLSIIDNSGSICKTKYTLTKSGKSITCDFTKDLFTSLKSAAGDQAWSNSMSLGLLLAMQVSYGSSTNAPIQITGADGKKVSVPCIIN